MSRAITHSLGTGREACVDRIDFGLISSEEARRMSTCCVTEAVVYDKVLPRRGGVNDLRMGTVDRRLRCSTCCGTMDECPGHFGHIELPAPCYNVGYLDVVAKTLRCVCFFCSRSLLRHDEPRVAKCAAGGKARLSALMQVARCKRECPACGGPQPTYTTQSGVGIKAEFGVEALRLLAEDERALAARPFTAFDARSVLRNVPDDDLRWMGFNPARAHPADMILEAMLVPPPIIRPSIMAIEGSRSRGQDDITIKLQEIIKACHALASAIARDGGPSHDAAPSKDVASLWEALQYHVATMYNNDIRGVRQSLQRSGAPSRCIYQRLKGKEGRVRGNLMGKRVNFSSRSVIGGDPIIDPDEVGVPLEIAKVLTVPERVTPWNVDDLTARINAGPDSVAGAHSVITGDGRLVVLKYARDRSQLRLQYGWTVERYLRDGDVVVFNRQPSLHKMSMMGHRVRLMNDRTFRLNLVCCPPYNADFDGDEMNLHVPQSESAIAEVAELMMVPSQLINPQNNRPVMGIVQDALVGSFTLTRRGVLLTEGDMDSLRVWARHRCRSAQPPAVLWPVRRFTGKQLLSELLPAISIKVVVRDGDGGGPWAGLDDAEERRVIVRDGRVLSGALCGRILKTSHGGLVHRVAREHGPKRAVGFMGDCQRVVNQWLALQGFSVGIGDCLLGAAGTAAAATAVAGVRSGTDMLRAVASAHRGGGGNERNEGGDEEEEEKCIDAELEAATSKLLASALNDVGASIDAVRRRGALDAMVRSGSKGSPINLSQIIGCVGQQSVEGRRIGAGAPRSLPRFEVGDNSPEARAFVDRPYVRGLRPHQFFFHAMGGREGLVDTAVKTATTGYTQRKLMKALESLRVGPDASVWHVVGTVLQLRYGGDGLDASHMEGVPFAGLFGDVRALAAATSFDLERDLAAPLLGEQQRRTQAQALVAELEHTTHAWRAVRAERLRPMATRLDDRLIVAFHPGRVLQQACAHFGRGPASPPSDLLPSDVLSAVDEVCDGLRVCSGEDHPEFSAHIRALVRREWTSRRIIRDLRLDVAALRWAVREALRAHAAAQAPNGEMVGAIGAESIGEPCTQLTLNTFHFSGNMEKNVTLGVPRLKELLDATRDISTPYAKLRPSEGTSAQALAHALERTSLGDVVVGRMQLLHAARDGDRLRELDEADRRLLEASAPFAPPPDEEPSASIYTLRMELDSSALRKLGVAAEELAETVAGAMGLDAKGAPRVHCAACSEGPWGPARMRVRPLGAAAAAAEGPQSDEERGALELRSELERLVVGGFVDTATVTQDRGVSAPPDGDAVDVAVPSVMTKGCSSLRTMMGAPGVDWTTVTCNSVQKTLVVLGVEAAVAVLVQEIRRVLSFDGTYINLRHIVLVADAMTMRGTVSAISRHGINRMPTGPLVRSSFEETVDTFLDAGAFAEEDAINGVTEHVMVGRLAPVGTGACRVRAAARCVPEDMQRKKSPDDVVRSFVTRPYRPALVVPGGGAGSVGALAASTCAVASVPGWKSGPEGASADEVWHRPYNGREAGRTEALEPFVPSDLSHAHTGASVSLQHAPNGNGDSTKARRPWTFRPSSPDHSRACVDDARDSHRSQSPPHTTKSVYTENGRVDFGGFQELLVRLRRR